MGGATDTASTVASVPTGAKGVLTLVFDASGVEFTHEVSFESTASVPCTLAGCDWAFEVSGTVRDDPFSDGTWDPPWPHESVLEHIPSHSGSEVVTFLDYISETMVAGDYFEVTWTSATRATLGLPPPTIDLCEDAEFETDETCEWTGWIEVAY